MKTLTRGSITCNLKTASFVWNCGDAGTFNLLVKNAQNYNFHIVLYFQYHIYHLFDTFLEFFFNVTSWLTQFKRETARFFMEEKYLNNSEKVLNKL